MLCIVIEFPAAEGLVTFTQENPGGTIELMGEAVADDNQDTVTALMLVRGAPWAAIDKFVVDLGASGSPATMLRRVPAEALWFGRVTFHPSALRSPGAQALKGILAHVGPPWIHVEHGVVHLRARIKDGEDPEAILSMAQESLRAAGHEAQVVVQEVSPKDHSVWEGLVQRGIGISL